MKQETIALDTLQNKDLLDAQDLLLIQTQTAATKSELAKQMVTKHAELADKGEKLEHEQGLFLTALAMNLTIYFFSIHDSSKELFYFEKLIDYYQTLICQSKCLNAIQQSYWSKEVAFVFAQIHYYSAAIGCLEKAIEFSVCHSSTNQAITAEYYLKLADVNLQYALVLNKQSDAPALEHEKYLKSIQAINLGLKFAPGTLKAFLICLRAQYYLAAYYQEHKQIDNAFTILIQAIQTGITGISSTNSSHNQAIFTKHIIKCIDKLKKLLNYIFNHTNPPENFPKENIQKMIQEITKLKVSVMEQVDIQLLEASMKSIHNLLEARTYSPVFWKKKLNKQAIASEEYDLSDAAPPNVAAISVENNALGCINSKLK